MDNTPPIKYLSTHSLKYKDIDQYTTSAKYKTLSVLLRNLAFLLSLKSNNSEILNKAQSASPELHDPSEELKKQTQSGDLS